MHHADVITAAPLKIAQRLFNLGNQLLRIAVVCNHPLQALDPKQLIIGTTGLDHPIRQ